MLWGLRACRKPRDLILGTFHDFRVSDCSLPGQVSGFQIFQVSNLRRFRIPASTPRLRFPPISGVVGFRQGAGSAEGYLTEMMRSELRIFIRLSNHLLLEMPPGLLWTLSDFTCLHDHLKPLSASSACAGMSQLGYFKSVRALQASNAKAETMSGIVRCCSLLQRL